MPMKYIYGPVESRRLGLSLGITLTPYKICSFDCVYCQAGATTELTKERKEYISIEEILQEIKTWLLENRAEAEKLNYITLSGSGEPTLNINIHLLISGIKKLASIPVAVITNASLLNIPLVREALKPADLVVPSLDAVTSALFSEINRPQKEINVSDIIEGLVSFRREFKGRIWLEVMLVKGINDDLRHIKKIKEAAERINPDKIQLNSPVRVTAQDNIFSVDKRKLRKIKEILGGKCEII